MTSVVTVCLNQLTLTFSRTAPLHGHAPYVLEQENRALQQKPSEMQMSACAIIVYIRSSPSGQATETIHVTDAFRT